MFFFRMALAKWYAAVELSRQQRQEMEAVLKAGGMAL